MRALALAALLGALASAPAPAAQERPAGAPAVRVGGWSLPAGTLLRHTSESTFHETVTSRYGRRTEVAETRNEQTEVTEVRVVTASPSGPLTVVQRVVESASRWSERVGEAFVPVQTTQSSVLGRDEVFSARRGGWAVRLLGDGPPVPDVSLQARRPLGLDHAEYPTDRDVRVGETWTFGPELLARGYRDLAPEGPNRIRYRLDSLGTHDGHPVAWMSYAMAIRQQLPAGTATTQMDGVVARCLTHFLDRVHTARSVNESDESDESGVSRGARGKRHVRETIDFEMRIEIDAAPGQTPSGGAAR